MTITLPQVCKYKYEYVLNVFGRIELHAYTYTLVISSVLDTRQNNTVTPLNILTRFYVMEACVFAITIPIDYKNKNKNVFEKSYKNKKNIYSKQMSSVYLDF
jgi:hypothetical protein